MDLKIAAETTITKDFVLSPYCEPGELSHHESIVFRPCYSFPIDLQTLRHSGQVSSNDLWSRNKNSFFYMISEEQYRSSFLTRWVALQKSCWVVRKLKKTCGAQWLCYLAFVFEILSLNLSYEIIKFYIAVGISGFHFEISTLSIFVLKKSRDVYFLQPHFWTFQKIDRKFLCFVFENFCLQDIFLKKYDLYFVNQGCRISNPGCI